MDFRPRFINYPFYWDDAPVDLSFVYEKENPAGKHGFLTVRGDKFVFEDGTEARFWGTNFNSGVDFPPFEFSEKVAKRLAKIGVNIVRFHQMDAEWANPNIFQFSKGRRKGDTLDLDPESLRRLDYLIYCLKQEGIYIYLDLLTYRKFKSGDGIENASKLSDAAKPYNNYSRKLIELQKKFCYDLWSHINPYTGVAYKDEPAIVLCEIVNESDMFRFRNNISVEPYKTELVDMYINWLKEKGIELNEDEKRGIDFSSDNENMIEFLREVQEKYYREMISFMRGIGIKIPITGTNWSSNAANRKAQLTTDFCDGHAYWYGWKWGEYKKLFNNTPMVSIVDNPMLKELSFSRVLDKPFIVSEWDDPWPNEWRAESPVFIASIGSFQDWGGIIIHTYSYSPNMEVKMLGKEFSSSALWGVPYREGVFTTWNDPAKFGLFYHAALLFRRKDIEPAREIINVELDDMKLTPSDTSNLGLLTERHKLGMYFKGSTREDAGNKKISWDEISNIIGEFEGEIISDNGQLRRAWSKKIGIIDSKRTKIVYGFLGEAEKISLDGLEVKVNNPFAVIAISSLTDSPIESSNNLLLTTIGRAQNTGMKIRYEGEEAELGDIGQLPVEVEVIEAEMAIKTNTSNLKVYAINSEGFITGVIPSSYEDGMLKFKLGENFCSIYYLIQAE